MKLPSYVQRPVFRELLIITGFVALTAIMTWPWILHLRDAVPDTGDPYTISYLMWWDYYQTIHDPLNLFHATIFYPYRYTLAFGEYSYGTSLLFFPLFALGFRPLTIYSLAAFLSFPFTGYSTFRLARTLSGSSPVAWVAGIILAFIPYRFHHLAHMSIISSGWVPLVFEALVLFARKRTWKRAAWLGVAFLLNGLTCTSWLILTALPLLLSGFMLLERNHAWGDRRFWLRAGATLCLASLLLLPFLLPFLRVAKLHNFLRTPEEVSHYSARPINWLAAEPRNKLWNGLGKDAAFTEMVLFPGLLAPLLALAAFLLPSSKPFHKGESGDRPGVRGLALICLDLTIICCGILALLAIGYGEFRLRLFNRLLLTASSPARALFILLSALLVRCWIAYPHFIRNVMRVELNLRETIASPQRSELVAHGLLWGTTGFMGSFGLNFFFHRALYELIPLFQGMRVAARWAMICYFGLALLAGLGACRVAGVLQRRWSSVPWKWGFPLGSSRGVVVTIYCLIILAILFEFRVAPLPLIRGEADPDAITQYLKEQQMSGGIVGLPTSQAFLYMLRAADHRKPLITANYSFVPPIEYEIEDLSQRQPIPDSFLDLLEEIPASYLAIYNDFFPGEGRVAIEDFLARGTASGRLRFIKSFDAGSHAAGVGRDDLYVVTNTEPHTRGDGEPPALARLPSSAKSYTPDELTQTAIFIIRFYKVAYGRVPQFSEFKKDLAKFGAKPDPGTTLSASEDKKREFAEDWLQRKDFRNRYSKKSDEQFLNELFANAGWHERGAERERLLQELKSLRTTRQAIVRAIVEDPAVPTYEFNATFVVLNYFLYLVRNPDPAGYYYWLTTLNSSSDYVGVIRSLNDSRERLEKTSRRHTIPQKRLRLTRS